MRPPRFSLDSLGLVLTGLGATILSLFLLIPLNGVGAWLETEVLAEDGVLDAPGLTWEVHRIGGTWEVFPGVLADPQAVVTRQGLGVPGLSVVPGALKRPDPAGAYDPSRTLATYHLRLDGLTPGHGYGILLKEVASSYRLYVDGRLRAFRGVPSEDRAVYRAEVGPRVGLFIASGSSAEIVLQVADFTSSLGGVWQAPYGGPYQEILDLQARFEAHDLFFLSGLWMLALVFWILAFVLVNDRAMLFCALFSTALVVKSAFSETMQGFLWFPWLSYEAGMALAYLSVVVLLPLFVGYFQRCFPEDLPVWAVRATWVPAAVETLVVLGTPFEFYQATFLWFQFCLLAAAAVLLATGLRAVVRKRQGAGVFLAGFLVVLATGINDILFSQQVVRTGFFLGAGIVGFLLSQGIFLAYRYRGVLEKSKIDGEPARPSLGESLEGEFESFRRYGQVFSILLVETDREDEAMVAATGDFIRQWGPMALSGRWGPRRFLIVLRRTRTLEALKVGEDLRATAARGPSTLSIGVAESTPELDGARALLERAGRALERAVALGRDRVEAG